MTSPAAAIERDFRAAINAQYPHGWFVAIDGERVLAAESDFPRLEQSLRTQGRDPRQVLVLEAGVSQPAYVTIFI
jgi:hypothetical protein